MSVKSELQNIISGNGAVKYGKTIQTINRHLRGKKDSIFEFKKEKLLKFEETKILIEYINQNNFWYQQIDKTKYIGEGAEQKIYEHSNPKFIIKLNDSVFYKYWEDYFNSLLIHNYFFPHLAYKLLGFHNS